MSEQPLLTPEDFLNIDKMVIGFVRQYYTNKAKNSPKQNAKILLKSLNTKKDVATSTILEGILGNEFRPQSTPSLVSSQFLSLLGLPSKKSNQTRMEPIDDGAPKKYLAKSELSESLKFLKEWGVTEHLQSKSEVSKRSISKKGRPKTRESRDDLGGMPSYYSETHQLESFKATMQKPSARQLIYHRLNVCGVIDDYIVFTLQTILYLLKLDPNVISRTKEMFPKRNLNFTFFERVQNLVQNSTDSTIEERALEMQYLRYFLYEHLIDESFILYGLKSS